MKTIFVLSCCMLLFFQGIAQADSLQKEINEQVWKPFIRSFNNDDQQTFRSVHSKEVARVVRDAGTIMGYDEYFPETPDSVKAKWRNWKKNVQLRFTQRIAGNGKAFEAGYYKSTSTNIATGEERTGYGGFYVLLRKENGIWKILMDADAGEQTNESIFLTGAPME